MKEFNFKLEPGRKLYNNRQVCFYFRQEARNKNDGSIEIRRYF